MKKQACNPYLPLDTYIPDGEPHVFGDRMYVYGSHDKAGVEDFCLLDYECWSGPVDDLNSAVTDFLGGTRPLYFVYEGNGRIDFLEFELTKVSS